MRRLRRTRTAQWLADRTKELGYPLTRTVISDLEVGRRRYVTVPELIVIARALDTAPVALLYPYPYIDGDKIQVLPAPEGEEPRLLPKIDAVQWFSGVLDIFPLSNLGMSLVDQSNYFSNLQGLERARKVFDLFLRNQRLSVQLGILRRKRRDGESEVSDVEIDDLVEVIDENQARIDELLSRGDRDLNAEAHEQFWNDHVSRGEEGSGDGG